MKIYNSSYIADKIKKTAKDRGVSIKKLLHDIGLGFNTMSNMKTSMPKADNLAKIADYLDCSVDYLLGRTDIPEVNKGNIKKIDFSSISPEELYKLIALGGEQNEEQQPPIPEQTT